LWRSSLISCFPIAGVSGSLNTSINAFAFTKKVMGKK
jgi:D-alanyl-D-alanine carboxypeptidase